MKYRIVPITRKDESGFIVQVKWLFGWEEATWNSCSKPNFYAPGWCRHVFKKASKARELAIKCFGRHATQVDYIP